MPVTPETYPNSSVFVNSLGITAAKALAEAEASITLIRTEQYRTNPLPPRFDLVHLRAIHRHLFGDIYSWAGELRGYDIRKSFCEFTPHSQIEPHAISLYGRLREENYLDGLDLSSMIHRLAYYYDRTNALHPFPEGNGRTQRLFIEHLAAVAGYRVDWGKAHAWQIVAVAEQSFEGNFEPTVYLFEEITSPLQPGFNWALNG